MIHSWMIYLMAQNDDKLEYNQGFNSNNIHKSSTTTTTSASVAATSVGPPRTTAEGTLPPGPVSMAQQHHPIEFSSSVMSSGQYSNQPHQDIMSPSTAQQFTNQQQELGSMGAGIMTGGMMASSSYPDRGREDSLSHSHQVMYHHQSSPPQHHHSHHYVSSSSSSQPQQQQYQHHPQQTSSSTTTSLRRKRSTGSARGILASASSVGERSSIRSGTGHKSSFESISTAGRESVVEESASSGGESSPSSGVIYKNIIITLASNTTASSSYLPPPPDDQDEDDDDNNGGHHRRDRMVILDPNEVRL